VSLEILLVVDNEAIAQVLSATLRRAGHHVTASTTIAGTVETLMRRGPYVDVIMTSTQFNSTLADDAMQYGRKFAVNARLIVLRQGSVGVEDIERLQTICGWN
jgi:CheY-like chemotaxis protein